MLLACVLVLVPPSVFVLIEALLTRLPRAREALHLALVGLLVAVFVLQLLGDLGGVPAAVVIGISLAVGGAGALAYARERAVSAVLTVLSPAPLVILGLFLLVSPVSDLVLPQDEAVAAQTDIASRVPVVMLVFDEFDGAMLMDADGRVDRSRYPNFAALAARGTWYRNATTVADRTLRAVPALLSGRRPPLDALALPKDYPDTVFSLLGDSHSMHVSETATQLCPERLCGERERDDTGSRLPSLASDLSVVSLHLVLPRDLRSHLPNVDQTSATSGAPATRPATAPPGIPRSPRPAASRPIGPRPSSASGGTSGQSRVAPHSTSSTSPSPTPRGSICPTGASTP